MESRKEITFADEDYVGTLEDHIQRHKSWLLSLELTPEVKKYNEILKSLKEMEGK